MKANHTEKQDRTIKKTKINFSKIYANFVLWGSLIGFVIGFLGSKGCLDKEAIDHKYVYYYNPNDSMEREDYRYVIAAVRQEDAEILHDYYVDLLSEDYNKANLYIDSINRILMDTVRIPKGEYVDIIEYREDSSIVEIRISVNNSKVRLYLSNITIHDTLRD